MYDNDDANDDDKAAALKALDKEALKYRINLLEQASLCLCLRGGLSVFLSIN